MKIVSNTAGTPLPKPDLTQDNPRKGNYVHGREEFLRNHLKSEIEKALEEAKESGEFTGAPGPQGEPGYTPVKGVDYFDGEPGKDGRDGKTPVKGVDYFDGEPGQQGEPGEPGKDGKTPVKGEDYFTEEDQQKLVEAVMEQLPENNMFANLPTFDLNEMGMPVLTLDNVRYECACDTTELMAAMDRSIVRIRADLNDGEKIFKAECLCMQAVSVSEDIHQAVVRGTIQGHDDFYDFRMYVKQGLIYLSATSDDNSADVSAEIEEALAAAKASGEFDGKDGQDGKDGADGRTPVKGVDYCTEADRTEMVNAVIDALPEDSAGIPTIDLMELGFQPQKQSNDVHFVTIDETIYNEILQKMEKGFVNVVFPIADGNDAYTYTVGLSCAGAKTDGTTGLVYGNSVYVNSNNANQFELYLTADRIGFRYNAYIPVMYSYQDMSEESKAQARQNIGAASVEDVLAALPTWTGGSY